MYNKLTLPSIIYFLTILIPNVSLAKVFPSDVVGRELDIPTFGWVGHIGIATNEFYWQEAEYVIEVLNEKPVIQINSLADFKKRSRYWGGKYGISNTAESKTRIINEGAFQTSLKCAKYTSSALSWNPGTGPYGKGEICPKFRCDTFVNYLYKWGYHTLPTYAPSEQDNQTYPKLVFDAFPYLRDEDHNHNRFYYSAVNSTKYIIPKLNINEANDQELQDMNFNEFFHAVDIPEQQISEKTANKMLRLFKDSNLSEEKRIFLMDKFGFVGKVKHLSILMKLFNEYQDEQQFSDLILNNIEDIYQHNISDPALNKKELIYFFTNILDNNIPVQSSSIPIRGIIALGTENVIFANLAKFNKIFANTYTDPGSNLVLQISLAYKSTALEYIYIPRIIKLLSTENNNQLDAIFTKSLVSHLVDSGINTLNDKSKLLIDKYLDKIENKLTKTVNSGRGMILGEDFGAWLEAKALISNQTLNSSTRYIARYLQKLPHNEQEKYLTGLARHQYLNDAFEKESILKSIKNKHIEAYENRRIR